MGVGNLLVSDKLSSVDGCINQIWSDCVIHWVDAQTGS